MEDLIQQLCALRQYKPMVGGDRGVYETPEGNTVSFYYVEVLTSEFMFSLQETNAHRIWKTIVFYDKQKKLRIPFEILSHFELFQIRTLRLALIPNRICPRFERLEGAERAQMAKHLNYLPSLLNTDPMAQIYGFNVGDIVKIYRHDGSLYFRRVVPAN